MTQDNFMSYYKVAFLSILCQIIVSTSLEDRFYMMKTLIEWIFVDGEIINENLK